MVAQIIQRLYTSAVLARSYGCERGSRFGLLVGARAPLSSPIHRHGVGSLQREARIVLQPYRMDARRALRETWSGGYQRPEEQRSGTVAAQAVLLHLPYRRLRPSRARCRLGLGRLVGRFLLRWDVAHDVRSSCESLTRLFPSKMNPHSNSCSPSSRSTLSRTTWVKRPTMTRSLPGTTSSPVSIVC